MWYIIIYHDFKQALTCHFPIIFLVSNSVPITYGLLDLFGTIIGFNNGKPQKIRVLFWLDNSSSNGKIGNDIIGKTS